MFLSYVLLIFAHAISRISDMRPQIQTTWQFYTFDFFVTESDVERLSTTYYSMFSWKTICIWRLGDVFSIETYFL